MNPIQEPLRETALRALRIAIIVGSICALVRHRGRVLAPHAITTWVVTALLGLWIAFAGHWVEVFYLNWLRQRLPRERPAQIMARLAFWFLGGIAITGGMALVRPVEATLRLQFAPWWASGILFIGLELFVHMFALQLRGKPSFYNGKG